MGKALPRPRGPRRFAPWGAIDHAVKAVRADGMHLASVTVHPNGSIKLSAVEDAEKGPATLFEALDKQGGL